MLNKIKIFIINLPFVKAFMTNEINKIKTNSDQERLELIERIHAPDYLKREYKKIRTDEMILETKTIYVKKGKRRYTLLLVETIDGKVKINIGKYDSGR